jgi:hypothetical protein
MRMRCLLQFCRGLSRPRCLEETPGNTASGLQKPRLATYDDLKSRHISSTDLSAA